MKRWSLPNKIDELLLKKDRKGVLYTLSQITALNNQLFAEIDEEYLRYVGSFRIQTLMDWEMYREALAWVCLDLELYPHENTNQMLKEMLKERIYNLPKHRKESINPQPWKGVAGMYELKATIERDIIQPLQESELYKRYNVSIPKGFLFYGPPGCGKTFFASKIAERINYKFIKIKTSDIASIYIHGTQLEIKKVFDEARAKQPVVLLLDEIESMVPNRASSDVNFSYKSEVNEFLGQLENDQNKGMIIIGATNYLNSIDNAILRPGRFDKKIFIGPPDAEARAEGFKLFLKSFPQDKIRYDYIAEMSEYFTYSDIKTICEDIKRSAISAKTKITTDLVGKHITRFKPQLNEGELQKYF